MKKLLVLALLAVGCRTQLLTPADGGAGSDAAPIGGLACSTDGTRSCAAGEGICCWTYGPPAPQGVCAQSSACQADIAAACTRPSDCPGQVCCFHFLNRRTQFTDCLPAAQCAMQQGEPLCPSSACNDRDCCDVIGPAGSKVCSPGQCPGG